MPQQLHDGSRVNTLELEAGAQLMMLGSMEQRRVLADAFGRSPA